MKRFFCFIIFFVLIFCMNGCFLIKQNTVAELKDYNNTDLKISLKYPSNWKIDATIPFLGKLPSRYFGTDGFFALNVITSENLDLEALVKREASSGDYGNNPITKRMIHNARIGYLILPSIDQREDEKHRSCFITELRNVYRSNQINFDILVLFADQNHLMNLINTLEN